MKEKLIKTMELTNGMHLNFYDASRRLVGDRWLISLIIRMEIPVVEVLINDEEKFMDSVDEIKKVLGEKVLFEQKRDRIFVSESEKQTVFEEVYNFFIDSVLSYLSNKAFPKRYVLKKYREKVEQESWYH
jgi:dGTP triphosphohydrolase